ncbi:pentatricopeptide repeat (PPR-like) superfamily protein [Carex rostrata]
MHPHETSSTTNPPPPPSQPKPSVLRKHYFYHGPRAARFSPHRPIVNSHLLSRINPLKPFKPSSSPSPNQTPPKPFSFSDWDPHSPSPPPPLHPPASPSLSDRRLSPLARFILSSLRLHKRWGPEILADLSKLRHVPPPLVVEVLRSRPPLSPSLSTPFFLWAGKQKRFRHDYASFNAFAHLLSLTRRPGLADQVPDLMRMHGKPPTEKQLDVLVKLHSQTGHPLRALEIFRKMRAEFGIKPRVFLYNRLFEALIRKGHVDQALSVYNNEFREDGLKEEAITFTIIVKGLSRVGRVEEVVDMLEQMRSRVCKPDLFAYTAMVKLMADRGNMDGCLRIWDEMKRDGLEIDAMGYATMVSGLCKDGKVEKGCEFFAEMKRKKMLIDRSVYGSLIEGFVGQARVGQACGILQEMMDMGYRADLKIYDTLISGLCNIGRVDKACKLFEIVVRDGLKPGLETVSPLLVLYADLGQMDLFFRLVDRISDLGLPVIDHLTDFLKLFLDKGGSELHALKIFNEMLGKGYCSVEIYNMLIESLYKVKEQKRAILLFEEMKRSEKYLPDSGSYSLIIPCLVEEGDVREACSCYNAMIERSYTPTVNAYCSLVKGLCKIGEIDPAIALVRDCLGTLTSGPMEFKYALTIVNVCKTRNPDKVVSVLDEMIELNYPLEEITYCAIIHGFCKYASSAEARKVFAVLQERGVLTEANCIAYEEILNEHLNKVTAGLVISGLKFFGLESDLKWATNPD